MKQLFALFCAFVLLPSFSAHAWIGGPFSNNTFFGEVGDDGVYEAVATTENGIGVFRIVVGNEFPGVNPSGVVASAPAEDAASGDRIIEVPGLNSGNIIIGAFGTTSNIWYLEGVSYLGTTLGTVNSTLGVVFAIGEATGAGGDVINSGFTATMTRAGRFLPVSGFSGEGQLQVSTENFQREFSVVGTKVSNSILFGL